MRAGVSPQKLVIVVILVMAPIIESEAWYNNLEPISACDTIYELIGLVVVFEGFKIKSLFGIITRQAFFMLQTDDVSPCFGRV